jgi:hypothetical protein
MLVPADLMTDLQGHEHDRQHKKLNKWQIEAR